MKQAKLLTALIALFLCTSHGCMQTENDNTSMVYRYGDILDIRYTPNNDYRCGGWFVDRGSWMGFTLPDEELWVNGVCGPFNLESRRWLSPALVTAGFAGSEDEVFVPDSVNYFPGELFLSATSPTGNITQRMIFLDRNTALLKCVARDTDKAIRMHGTTYADNTCEVNENSCLLALASGEQLKLSFEEDVKISRHDGGYEAIVPEGRHQTWVVLSFCSNHKEHLNNENFIGQVLARPTHFVDEHHRLWENSLRKVLRTDMPREYDRVAVKAVMTLMSNWKSSRGGLLHEGVVPSHAVGYFMGFWAWDSWKHAVALSAFIPELAKNQVRAMFDYQLEDGMVIDCIYPDIRENNDRDSKPPLAAWAVHEIYLRTGDTAFVKEMYPHLYSYYRWWYEKRDHNRNHICEFGSTDGTLEAAAWESGMDNAIRFDNARMVKNGAGAWSFDQESVDLNAFLAYEHSLMKKLAQVAGQAFTEEDYTEQILAHFFDKETGFFFDRHLNGEFIREEGSEAYIPFWTGIATKEQMDRAMTLFADTAKFSTYIPFPTVAADNPKFMPKGYWRGPIWLDQTYFGISGLRKYGYSEQADKYTRQVFDRLQGLTADGAIHENYGTHTGEQLKAPHFSWSAAHLLMLYGEYGK